MGVLNLVGGAATTNEYLEPKRRTEPTIEAGQVWLVECGAGSLSAFHTALLERANVVLYERALVAVVAEALPIGGYAEPLSATGPLAAGPTALAVAPRARQFAADGWGVLQLVEKRAGWRHRLDLAAEQLTRSEGGPPLLAIGTILASQYREWRGPPEDLAIVTARLDEDELLSLTFAAADAPPPARRRPMQGHAFTANGLAG
jgi:hypothetical protein